MDIFNKNQFIRYSYHRFPAATLKGKFKKYSTEKLHYHDTHQVLLFNQGISLLLDEKKKQPLFNRATAFIPAGCPHRSIVLGREVEYKTLYLDKKLFLAAPQRIRIFDMSELGLACLRKIEIPLGENPAENEIDELQWDCLMLFLKVLKEDINQHAVLARLPVARLSQSKVIIDYLEKHYQEKIELKDIARLLPYTARHISRLFKKDVNISIFEYLKIYRILQASIRLKTNDKTVTEIAYACGYNSISCFFNDFGRFFSISPKQFRHQRQNN
jgi:AraC-like DNA-binding protein